MGNNTCDIDGLEKNFPKKDFNPWSSEGEAMLSSHYCDLITIPTKNGMLEHIIGNKVNPQLFVASGFIQSVMSYDEEKEKWVGDLGNLHSFRKKKIVLTGQNGTGTILSLDDASKLIKSLNKVVDTE